MEDAKLFIPLHRMAATAGVPEEWLRAEIRAGRIPSLRIGRRILCNRELVQNELLRLAKQSAPSAVQEALAHA